MSDIHELAPCAAINEIELLAQTRALRIWSMRTDHDLKTILADGYFDSVAEMRFQKDDRIEVVASASRKGEHATLVVDALVIRKPKVSLLHKYERR